MTTVRSLTSQELEEKSRTDPSTAFRECFAYILELRKECGRLDRELEKLEALVKTRSG